MNLREKNQLKKQVSVIITTYRRNDRLRKCIDSVLNQTHVPNEIIVVHDGYSKSYQEFASSNYKEEQGRSYIRFMHTQNWMGRPAPGRNFGIENSKFDYVCFCDDDDVWMPRKLEMQVEHLESYEPDAVFTQVREFQNNEEINYLLEDSDAITNDFCQIKLPNFLDGRGLALSTAMIRRKVIPESMFPESNFCKAFEDWALWINLLLNNSVINVLDKELVFYLVNNPSSIRGRKISQTLRMSFYTMWILTLNGFPQLAGMHLWLRAKYLFVKYFNGKV